MYKVAINTAITAFKKTKRKPDKTRLTFDNFQIPDDNSAQIKEDNLRLLREAVSKLSGIEKSIILLFLENKGYEEIAEITGITQNYVRVKMNRIKKKLKILITAEEE